MTKNKKKSCFVVGPIGSVGSETRDQADMLLHYIIKPALEPLGYDVRRADDEQSPINITDHVINSTLDADLVVADLTDANANAFYELGIRHREEKPVIHMMMEGQKPPFDVANFNTIFYCLNNPADHGKAITQLAGHAKAIDGEEFKVSNPITAARGHKQLSQSSDNTEQMVSALMSRVTSMEAALKNLEFSARKPYREILDTIVNDIPSDYPTSRTHDPLSKTRSGLINQYAEQYNKKNKRDPI